jgi:hypothetical protein
MNYLPRLASNLNPPDLCLLSSQDYKSLPPVSLPPVPSFSCSLINPKDTDLSKSPFPPGVVSLDWRKRETDRQREPVARGAEEPPS